MVRETPPVEPAPSPAQPAGSRRIAANLRGLARTEWEKLRQLTGETDTGLLERLMAECRCYKTPLYLEIL